jgi:DMSO/TMAO reductase YedYZ molybdopterin-dependent catalytic subunit
MEYNPKMLEAKRRLLERFRNKERQSSDPERQRLPPGQHLAKGFPILDLGVRPKFHAEHWRLQVAGEVEEPREWNWEDFCGLPHARQVSDFHCVTTWSKFDVEWGGVKFVELAARVRPTPQARFVIALSADGYTTNLPIADCLDQATLLADALWGEPLPVEHGGPVRLLVPHLYAWKSAKFLRKLVFAKEDQPGFWEQRGYHRRGDPWREERYG